MKKSDNSELFIPLIASSLLNAIYSRILITSPLQFDEQVFQRESAAVIQQWEVFQKSFETVHLKRQGQKAQVQKIAAEFLSNELDRVKSRIEEIAGTAQTSQLQQEKKMLEDKLQALFVLIDRLQP
jgi:hypothetical protein